MEKEKIVRNPSTGELHEILTANNKTDEETEEPKDQEIIDSNTAEIRYLLNDLINKTGIISSINLQFKKELTPIILQVLSKHKTILTETGLQWKINNYETNVEITIEQYKCKNIL